VIVTSNMNGDIISDLAAGLVGGLGIAPSSNLGDHAAMFEAVHGSAPQIAGKGLANPTALLSAAIMLLRHISAFDVAETIEQALFITLAEGKNLTGDLSPRGHGVGTAAFTDQLIANLGRTSNLPSRRYRQIELTAWPELTAHTEPNTRELVGIDVFLETDLRSEELGKTLETIAEDTPLERGLESRRAGLSANRRPDLPGRPFRLPLHAETPHPPHPFQRQRPTGNQLSGAAHRRQIHLDAYRETAKF
jgi:isocitrate dehydrogenase